MENNLGDQLNSGHALKWGAIKGLIAVFLNFVVFLISTDLLQNGFISFALWVINVGLLIYAGFDHRKQFGNGFMTFGVAYKHAFLVMAISGLIGTIYALLLYNVIAPEFRELMTEKQMEGAMAGGGGNGEMLDTLEFIFSNMFKPLGLAVIYLASLIGYAIGALIIALITKKKNTELDF